MPWLTVKEISSECMCPESILRYGIAKGFIRHKKVGGRILADDAGAKQYAQMHMEGKEYLLKMIEEKKEERDAILAAFDDGNFLLKTHLRNMQLFRLSAMLLSMFIKDKRRRNIFYSISLGTPVKEVAENYGISCDRAFAVYGNALNELHRNRKLISRYKDRITGYKCRYVQLQKENAELKAKNKRIKLVLSSFELCEKIPEQVWEVLEMPLKKMVNDRIFRRLRGAEIETVEELLRYALIRGWKNLLTIKGFGEKSFSDLAAVLKDKGIIDDNFQSEYYQYIYER